MSESASNRLRAERAEAHVAQLEKAVAAKQARIDALMLEYCPDEMTPEQVAEWARHQRPVSEQKTAALETAREDMAITDGYDHDQDHVPHH